MLSLLFLQDIFLNLKYEFGKDLLRKIKSDNLRENMRMEFSPPYRPVFTYEEVLSKIPSLLP
jgi:hypothetical protein